MSADTRLWMYRKGEARLFGHSGLVPENEDWQRFPMPDEDGALVSASSPLSQIESARDPEDATKAKLDLMSRQRLMKVAADCGVRFSIGWTKAQFKQAIIEALHDNGT
jgi:hypothetical protein